jgi:hypothetical protein
MIRFIFRCILFFIFSTFVVANEYKPLSADYMIAGKIAFGDLEEGTTHLYIRVNNKAAIELYDSLDVEERIDECTTLLSKKEGKIECYKSKDLSESYCIFAVNLKENKIEYGETC